MNQKRYFVTEDFEAIEMLGTSYRDLEARALLINKGEILVDLNESVNAAGIVEGSLMAIERLHKPIVVQDYDHANCLKLLETQ